jgi:DNA mismatch repair protein MutS
MGGRLLRSWVEQPLLDKNEINHRLDDVAELVGNRVIGISLSEALDGIYDLERLLSKVSYRNLNARDCLALCASFKKIPAIKNLLSYASSYELKSIRDELDTMEDLTNLLESSIHPDAPILITEGGIIRDGYSQELDEYREAQKNGKQWILDLEQKERDATGIRNLRVQYNKVFGYYIEVTKSFLNLVPDHYIRKQTLTGAERFMTPELKEIEQKIIGAQEQSVRLELQIFNDIRDRISAEISRIQ